MAGLGHKPTFVTTNMDLAAALWAAGSEPTVMTRDGVVVEFVFSGMTTDGVATVLRADAWERGALNVDAKSISVCSRRLRTMMRKTTEDYAHERRKTLNK